MLAAQFSDHGLGGYGRLDFNVLESGYGSALQVSGGGGIIVNKTLFLGVYGGGQFPSYSNFNFGKNVFTPWTDSMGLVTMSVTEIGIQTGAYLFADKSVQVGGSLRLGDFLVDFTEIYTPQFSTESVQTSRVVNNLVVCPQLSLALCPGSVMKIQINGGYRWVYRGPRELIDRNFFNGWLLGVSFLFGTF